MHIKVRWFQFSNNPDGGRKRYLQFHSLLRSHEETPMKSSLVLTIAMVAFVGLAADANAQCLIAEHEDEYAEGTLTQRTFRDAAGRPEPAFILSPPSPICLSGEEETDNIESARSIQIFSSNESVERTIRRFIGQNVFVRGTAFGAMTVHHHAPVVMDVSVIDSLAAESAGSHRIVQPERGSGLRAELLNAARTVFETETGGSIEFQVKRLSVMGDWAFGEVRLQRPGGRAIDWKRTKYAEDFEAGMFDPDGSFFLLRRTSAGWTVLEFATGPTDIAWDSWRLDHRLPLALFQQ
jgi:hypothetical protein